MAIAEGTKFLWHLQSKERKHEKEKNWWGIESKEKKSNGDKLEKSEVDYIEPSDHPL